MRKLYILTLALLFCFSLQAAVPDLTPQVITLQNPNFKTTGFTGWTVVGDWSDKNESSAPDGNYVRIMVTSGDLTPPAMLSQKVEGLGPGTYVLTAKGGVSRNGWGGDINTVGKGSMYGCIYVTDNPEEAGDVDAPGCTKIGETGGDWTDFMTMFSTMEDKPELEIGFGIPASSSAIPKGNIRVDMFELRYFPTMDQEAVKAYLDNEDYTMVEGVTISESTKTVTNKDPFTLTATISPADYSSTQKGVIWSSSNSDTATVDEDGTVTPTGAGVCYIIASSKANPMISDKCELTVDISEVQVTGVTVSVEGEDMEPKVEETKTLQLIATVEPENATIKRVAWSSSDPTIATVDENGLVTGIKAGKVNIIATSEMVNTVTGTLEITVYKTSVTKITLSEEDVEIELGKTLQLSAEVEPIDSTYPEITWTSSDSSIATVDENGLVTGIAPGNVEITAMADGVSAICKVTVKSIGVEDITLNSSSEKMVVGAEYTLVATVIPSNASDPTVTWTTSDASVATVSEGVVKGTGIGTVTITATAGDKSATCTFEVVASVELQSESINIINPLFEASPWDNGWDPGSGWAQKTERNNQDYGGKAYARLYASSLSPGAEGNFITQTVTLEKPGVYSLSAYARASRNHNGGLSDDQFGLLFIKEGEGIPTEYDGLNCNKVRTSGWEWVQKSVVITITEPNTSVTFGYGIPKECPSINNGNLECSDFVLKYYPTTLDVNAVNACVNKLVYTMVSSIEIPETLSLEPGNKETITANITPADATNSEVVWTTNNDKVATVDQEGTVTAVAGGTAVITVTSVADALIKSECTVTVKVAVTGVSLNITETEVVEGTTVQLEATVEPETATDKTVTWTSDKEDVATVDENGLVTTKTPGTATITATAGEAKATCVITVTAKPIEVEGIELKTKEATVAEGTEFKIEYVINPENATDKTVTWTSSNGEVATVDSEGNVKAVAAGEATISAKAGEYTDKCLVIVKKNVAGVTIDKTTASINVGETVQLTAEIDPEDAIVTTVTWSSSNEKVATVDETGLVTGVGGGNADITATAGEKSATCKITVIVPVTGLSVLDEDHNPLESGVTIPLHTGDTYNLTAVVTPENATDPSVTWTSSDTEVAEVDEEGLIETHKAGEATITAKIGEFSFEAKVVVTDPVIAITGISLNKTEAEMLTGETLTLVATIEPEDASSKEVGWKSSNTAIATVDKKGVVTALKAGEVTITASANKLTATCKITIKDPVIPVTGISLDEIKIDQLIEGKTVQLTATVAPENATDKTVVWSSDNEDVATVDQTGLVTAVAPGTANVTATAGEASATCEITVVAKPIEVEGIELDETEVTLVEGAVFELGYTINPETATDKTVTWSSSNEEVATVDSEGKVTAVAVGEAVITAKAGEKTAECKFIVKKAVAAVTLDKTEATIKVDDTLQLTATIVPENAIETKVTWTSDNEEVATVDENGLVTAIATGEAVITAEAGKMTATCKITVEPAVIAVTGVKLDVLEIDELMEGETVQLTATVEPDDAIDKTVTWSSDNEDVATVDQNGLVTAVAPGTVIITATSGDASATCKITVSAKPIAVEGIELNEKEVTLDVGAVFTIKYTIDPENATDKTVTWTSSDEKIATVDANGKVTAVAVGEAVITAKVGDKTATCKIIVEPAGIKVSEVTINLTEATIGVDELLYLEAIVTPADAIDAALTWTSSNEKVAKVDANGVVTAIAPGEAIITAKAGKMSAECKLTVEKPSGVEQIGFDPEAPIQVYNLSGLYVSDSIQYLKPGYYIIRQGDNVKKVFIK